MFAFSRFFPALIPWLLPAIAEGVVLTPLHDNNTLRSASGPVSNGQTISLKVAASTQTNARTGYFKFTDFSAATGAGNEAIFSVTNTNVPTANFNITVFALNASLTTGFDWDETTLAWGSGSPAFSSTDTYFIDSTAVTSLGSFTIPLNAAAGTRFSVGFSDWADFLQSNGSLTLIAVVTSQTGGDNPSSATLNLASAENSTTSYAPTLTIIPEPASLLFAACAPLALLRRRRP